MGNIFLQQVSPHSVENQSQVFMYVLCKQNKIISTIDDLLLIEKNYFPHMWLEFFPLHSCYYILCMKKKNIVTSSSSSSSSSSCHDSNNIYKFDDNNDGCGDGWAMSEWWVYGVWWDVDSITQIHQLIHRYVFQRDISHNDDENWYHPETAGATYSPQMDCRSNCGQSCEGQLSWG